MTSDVNKRREHYTSDMESRALVLFENSIKSEYTRKQYKYQLQRFITYYKLRDYDSILKIEQKQLQIMMEDYVLYLRIKLSPNSFDAPLGALQSFLEVAWPPVSPIIDLLYDISSSNIQQEIKKSLVAKVSAAIHSYADGNMKAGDNKLSALINEINAQKGKKIDAVLADSLIKRIHVIQLRQ